MPTTNETDLEKVFSDLAYSHLRDQSQALLDYLLSFEMIKADDDGQRAVGIFAFEIDGDIYYAPAFFLNGEVRGLDSLYSVKQDLFVPLTEDWVNTIINKRPQTIGEADTRSQAARGVRLPNYTRLKVIPGGGGGVGLKLASAMVWREDVVPSVLEVINELGWGPAVKKAAETNARFYDAFTKFYDLLDLDLTTKVAADPEKKRPVVVITRLTDDGIDSLNDDQRKTMMGGGAIVIDNRPDISKSELFSTETRRVLENPTGGGLYDILMADGSVEQAIIASNGSQTRDVVVFLVDSKRHCEICPQSVWAIRKYGQPDFHAALDKYGAKASDVSPGNTVFFISRQGNGTSGFCVDDVTKGVDGIKRLVIRDRYMMTAQKPYAWVEKGIRDNRGWNGNGRGNAFKHLDLDGVDNRPLDINDKVTEILVVQRGGDEPRYDNHRLVVNDSSFFAIDLNSFTEDSAGSESPADLHTEETYSKKRKNILLKPNDFGDYDTVAEALDKYASDLTVWKQGSDINVKIAGAVGSYKENDAIRYFVMDLGLGEDDARLLVKEAKAAAETYKIRIAVKTAADLLNLPEVNNTTEGGFMSQYHEQQIPLGNVNQARSNQNREYYRYSSPFGPGGGDAGDDNPEGQDASTSNGDSTLNVMDHAGQTGQRELFDAAALASLVKTYRPTEMVDRFLPTVVAGMDRLGRMLFLLYWHYDDFAERYGENDLADFMDNLKSAYEQTGDIVIFAKRRTLAGDPEHFGIGIRPSMDTAEEG